VGQVASVQELQVQESVKDHIKGEEVIVVRQDPFPHPIELPLLQPHPTASTIILPTITRPTQIINILTKATNLPPLETPTPSLLTPQRPLTLTRRP
jgi:hypothetical protein